MKTLRIAILTAGLATGGLTLPQTAEANNERMELSELPAPVKLAIAHEAEGGKVIDVEKLSDDGSLFKAEVKKDGRESEIYVNAQGKIVGRHLEK